MNDLNHEINLALRTAAGHERAAIAAEEAGSKAYEMKMKSAGASAYGAFVLAIKAAPEYQGRKIDDKAIRRIYESTKPRKWWDVHLAAVKVEGKPGTRDWANRTIQWHIDMPAAQARRAAQAANQANRRKRLAKQQNSAAYGRRTPQVDPTTAEMRELHAAGQTAALAGRELPKPREIEVTLEDLLGECSRLQSTVKKVDKAHRADALEILKVTAREIERYIS